jgi:hypothetical protein
LKIFPFYSYNCFKLAVFWNSSRKDQASRSNGKVVLIQKIKTEKYW